MRKAGGFGSTLRGLVRMGVIDCMRLLIFVVIAIVIAAAPVAVCDPFPYHGFVLD